MKFIVLVITAVVQFLAQLPAALPSLFVRVASSRIAKYPLSMDGAETSKGVT
jgi:hypothetical protein